MTKDKAMFAALFTVGGLGLLFQSTPTILFFGFVLVALAIGESQ